MTDQKNITPKPSDKQLDDDVTSSLQTFETRWRYAVFPAMITFVLLIGFMFYLIYGMLQRMEDLSRDIHTMGNVISEALPVMQGGVVGMSSRMQWVGEDMKKMSKNMNDMSNAITKSMPKLTEGVSNMSTNVNEMTLATKTMALTTHNMGQNIWDMNRNFSKPLSAMNKILPWSNKDRAPRPMMMLPPTLYQGQSMPAVAATTPPPGYVLAQPVTPAVVKAPLSAAEHAGESKYHGFCASCHGIHAEGGVGPSLHGKSEKYITQVLQEYRSGTRKGTMTGVVEVLSEDDMKNVSAFLGNGGLL
jgi:cytochrome c553